MPLPVTIDDALYREAAAWETDLMPIEFRGDVSPIEALNALKRAADGTDHGLDSPTRVAVDTFALMAGGAAVVVIHRGVQGLVRWLDQFASALSADGYAGRLSFAHQQRAPIDFPAPRLACAVAGLVFTTDPDRPPRRHSRVGGWRVAPAVTRDAVARAFSWSQQLDGDTYFAHHGVSSAVQPREALELLEEALRRCPPVSLCTVSASSDFRRVLFNNLGHVVYEYRDGDPRSHRVPSELVEVLKTHASALDYGFVRAASGPSVAWWAALTAEPPRPPAATGTYFQVMRDDEASYVPDAYGIQILTDGHLSRARDLSDWEVVPVVEGRYLVLSRHRDLWFRSEGPPRDLIMAARHDFGEMIITKELIREASRRDLENRISET